MTRLNWILAGLIPAAALIAQLAFADPWLTPDQRAQRALERGEVELAADGFEDAAWRGVALFRAGEFEQAATLLAGVSGPGAAYNRGNALIFLGRYSEAMESYDIALELRPEWQEAEDNRALAESRVLEQRGGIGTDGKLGADSVVFGEAGEEGGTSVEVTGGRELTDNAMREQWLRSVETRPADFLRAKFAQQRAVQERP